MRCLVNNCPQYCSVVLQPARPNKVRTVPTCVNCKNKTQSELHHFPCHRLDSAVYFTTNRSLHFRRSFQFNLRQIDFSVLCLKQPPVSCKCLYFCRPYSVIYKLWIYWLGVNTKFTIWCHIVSFVFTLTQ